MIHYQSGGWQFLFKVFQMNGSVFPRATLVAFPCGVITSLLTYFIYTEEQINHLHADHENVMRETQAWSGFQVLVGFLIVFRTSQSYNRFWDGCTSTHQMRAEWFDGCSALIAFCKHSKVDQRKIFDFQNTLIRLFSMLHAAALAAIEDSGGDGDDDDGDEDNYNGPNARFELIDAEGLDEDSLMAIRDSDSKVELIFQWIQSFIVENIRTEVLSIPPPILSRSFQEVAKGMVAFHEAMKISYIPFPFPYAQTCDFLLLMHWAVTPFVISQWIKQPWWAFIFGFVQVFILWALNFIAVELENPFGMDANDIDECHMQMEMNQHLLLLLRPSTRKTPTLSETAVDYTNPDNWTYCEHRGLCPRPSLTHDLEPPSFFDVWTRLAEETGEELLPAKRFGVVSLRQSVRHSSPDGSFEPRYRASRMSQTMVPPSGDGVSHTSSSGWRRSGDESPPFASSETSNGLAAVVETEAFEADGSSQGSELQGADDVVIRRPQPRPLTQVRLEDQLEDTPDIPRSVAVGPDVLSASCGSPGREMTSVSAASGATPTKFGLAEVCVEAPG